MGIYIGVYGGVALLSFYELFGMKKGKKTTVVFQAVLATTLFLLAVARGGPYGDYFVYKEVFEVYTVPGELFLKQNFVFEPLYSLLQWLCKNICDNFIFFEAVLALAVILSEHIYAASKLVYEAEKGGTANKGQFYFTAMYFLWGLYKCNILFIRSSIALVICMNTVKYIQKKDFKYFVCLILLASGFHYSALIFLPAYFIYHWHTKVSTKMVVFLASTVGLSAVFATAVRFVAQVIGGDFGNKLSKYFEVDGLGYGIFATGSSSLLSFLLRIVLNIGVLVLAGLYLQKIHKQDPFLEGYFNLYLVGSVLYIASLFSVGYAFARISIYYNAMQIPMLVSFFQKGKVGNYRNRLIYWIIISCYLFARFYINSAGQPFTTFWQ